MRLASILLALFLLPAATLAAGKRATDLAPTPDPRIGKQLGKLDYKYELDDQGDYKLVFGMDGDRSQLVFVISQTEEYGKHHIREIWSPAYRVKGKGKALPADIANRLLEDTQDNKLGAWAKQGEFAVYVVKIDARASAEELDDAINFAVSVADKMEAALTPGKDEF